MIQAGSILSLEQYLHFYQISCKALFFSILMLSRPSLSLSLSQIYNAHVMESISIILTRQWANITRQLYKLIMARNMLKGQKVTPCLGWQRGFINCWKCDVINYAIPMKKIPILGHILNFVTKKYFFHFSEGKIVCFKEIDLKKEPPPTHIHCKYSLRNTSVANWNVHETQCTWIFQKDWT